ncbi:hypothetical protein [Candidatus Thiodubiliella endoseptemdiera]|uniref:Uncharacterized protein n=1 Tax=Candidatus Thiodubiliella endoseptemdiera TaxID=2738886 RepID=A0A853F1A1_9GAMM|nr:hypothetical protein [Candidatus Thiodubiliella endoseptemdiera]
MIKINNTTNLKNISKYFLATTLALGLLSAANTVIANQNSTIDNYNDRYTPEGRKKAGKRGTYKKDIHVWVYTSAFAKRFGMPKQWIDDELKGAEALAYRLDLDVYGTKCGYFSEVENCRPSTACIVDMYIDDKADLPWNTENRFDSRYGSKSIGVLIPQNIKDDPGWRKRAIKRGQQYKLGLDRLRIVYGKNHRNSLGNYFTLEYDRNIYKNLDYLSGSLTCRTFGKGRNMKIVVENPHFLPSGNIDYRIKDTAHLIDIPDSFMQRIEIYDKAQYEPNSLFKALRDRLSTTTKPNQSK